ncbi:universal stress protein [Haliangium ochraceum]|uniref:UspA domain protein n=1 Tax=Haliangium ochraceum (strain DSM 14365 / JCM 11303 / SMP-2) TaxID=502025 RepID=D0LST6_HALO1|nr:universal stress protein [Haliangium ochraceum]ACY17308.1 UspA domain protein [Haliangium ochraceum DSM 14365]
MYDRILVPLDGSPRAECVLPHVEALGRHERDGKKPKIILVRVVEPRMRKLLLDPTAAFRSEAAVDTKALESARSYLLGVQETLTKNGLSVEARLFHGSATRDIVEAIDDFEVDLVVFAAQGATGMREALFGSVGSALLATVHRAALLVVHPESLSERAANRRIVVPLDGSSFAESILPHVEMVARAYGASLTLVRVVNLRFDPKVTVLDTMPDEDEPEGAETLFSKLEKVHSEQLFAEARKYLTRHQQALSKKGLKVDHMLLHGPVSAAIAHAAESVDADLVAMTSHGRSALGRMLYGGVAAGVLHRLARPMLVVRPEAEP